MTRHWSGAPQQKSRANRHGRPRKCRRTAAPCCAGSRRSSPDARPAAAAGAPGPGDARLDGRFAHDHAAVELVEVRDAHQREGIGGGVFVQQQAALAVGAVERRAVHQRARDGWSSSPPGPSAAPPWRNRDRRRPGSSRRRSGPRHDGPRSGRDACRAAPSAARCPCRNRRDRCRSPARRRWCADRTPSPGAIRPASRSPADFMLSLPP